MPTIKFSHRYAKLDRPMDALRGNVHVEVPRATLLQVLPVDLKDLTPEFLAYDTDNGKFTLPKSGKYLMLIFEAPGGIFTTLRPAWPPYKAAYYQENVGKTFDILFTQGA